jgi:chromosome segregation ATPase
MSYLFNKTTSGSLEQLGASIHRDSSTSANFKTGVGTTDYKVSTPSTKGIALAVVAASLVSTLPSIFNMVKSAKANSSNTETPVQKEQTEASKEVQSSTTANSKLEAAMKDAKKSGNWSDVDGLISGSVEELQANDAEQATLKTQIKTSDDNVKSYQGTIQKDEDTNRPNLQKTWSEATKTREAADDTVKSLAKQLDNPALTPAQKTDLQAQYNKAVGDAKTAKDAETAAKKAYDANEDEIKATKVKLTQEENNNTVLKQNKAHLITVHDKLQANILNAQQQVTKYTGKNPIADVKIDPKIMAATTAQMKKQAEELLSIKP